MSRDLHPAVIKDKYYQPEKWTAFHRYVVMLELAGKRPGEIAQIVGMTESRISVILNDRRAEMDRVELGGALADRLTDLNSKLELYAHEALEVVVDEMRDLTNKPELRVKAGFGIMDRAGYTAKTKDPEEQAPSVPSEVADRLETVAKELKDNQFSYRIIEPKISEGEEVMSD